jgi:chromosome segregation ATPase
MNDLARQEFELDAKLKEYQKIIDDHKSGKKKATAYELSQAETGVELTLPKLRQVQGKLYGWRTVRYLEGKVAPELKEIERLEREILVLETKEAQYQNRLDSYSDELKRAQSKLDNLRSQLGSEIGYNPEPDTLKQAQETVLSIGREASIAELELPRVRERLAELRKDLQKREAEWEKTRKRSYMEEKTYVSPSEEIDSKTQAYARDHEVSYAIALSEVFRAEPTLARIYVFGLED